MKQPTQETGETRLKDAFARPDTAVIKLFPECDPRGVLSRALARNAAPWSTRPDALVFGWMLALAPGMDTKKAATAVLTVAGQTPAHEWTEAQQALLSAIEDVRDGRARSPSDLI